mgnify:CR=1 FL=1
MKVEKDDDAILLSEDPDEISAFEAVVAFLLEGTFPSWNDLPTFDYLGIDPRSRYELTLTLEEEMRAKMYLPDYQDHPMNTDPHHGLIELTEEIWNQLEIRRPNDPDLLFNRLHLYKQPWSQVQSSLDELAPFFSVPGLLIAGGRVFSALFGTRSSDVDFFLYGSQDPTDGRKRLDRIFDILKPDPDLLEEMKDLKEETTLLRKRLVKPWREKKALLTNLALLTIPEQKEHIPALLLQVAKSVGLEGEVDETPGEDDIRCGDFFFHIKGTQDVKERLREIDRRMTELQRRSRMKTIRTSNAVTFIQGKEEYQLILRLYRTPSEILHGFDVDSCCFGWDGQRLWMTQRALYAICNEVNTVNFDRLSPSYERRLAKYGTRGVAVKVPNFNRKQVDREELEKKFQELAVSKKEWHKVRREWVATEVNWATDFKKLRDPRENPLRGLDTLIYLDFQAEKRTYRTGTIKGIESLAADASDYSGNLFKSQPGTPIESILMHLIDTRRDYPEAAAKYLPYLEGTWEGDDYSPIFNDPDLDDAQRLDINLIPLARQIDFIRADHWFGSDEDRPERLYKLLLEIPARIYDCLGTVRPWMIPRRLEWKVTDPGEQFTGSFHKTVLQDTSTWYRGRFYRC